MIKLVEPFWLDSDGTQYILRVEKQGVRKNPATGEKEQVTVYEENGFYPSMVAALTGCVKNLMLEKVRTGEATTIKQWITDIESLKDWLKQALKEDGK